MEGFLFLYFSLFQSLARNMKLHLKLKAYIYSFLKILVFLIILISKDQGKQ